MKRTQLTTYIILLALTLFAPSCSKLLEQEPKNSTYLEKFWQTTRDCESALAGNYALVRTALAFRNSYYMYGDAIAKNYFVIDYTGDGLEGIQNGDFSFTYNLNDFGNWTRYFKAITMSNTILAQIPKVPEANLAKDVDDVQQYRNRVMGQALFLRAFTYFVMTRIWGDVPLVTEYYENPLEAPQLPRSPKADVMKQIEKDCKEAAGLLEWGYSNNTGGIAVTANRGAVYALLAHLYLWRGTTLNAAAGGTLDMNDVNSADTTISALLANGGYRLTDTTSYYNTFIGRSTEGIFELNMSEDQFEGSDDGIGMQFLRGDQYIKYKGDYARFAVRQEYFSRHFLKGQAVNDTMDLRFQKGFDYRDDSRPLCRKYSNVVYRNPGVKMDPYMSNNMIIFRLADMMLLQAEIALYKGDNAKALQVINFFRTRNNTAALEMPGTSEELMYEYILERGKEMFLEGHLYYDLVRTKAYSYIVDWLTEQRYAKEGFYWPVDPRLFRGNKFLQQTNYWKGKI